MQVLCGLQGIFLLFNCQTPVIALITGIIMLAAFWKKLDMKYARRRVDGVSAAVID